MNLLVWGNFCHRLTLIVPPPPLCLQRVVKADIVNYSQDTMARTVNTPRSSMCLVQWRLLAFPSCKRTHARTHARPPARFKLRCEALFSQCWIPQLSAIIQLVPCGPVCLRFILEDCIVPSSLAEKMASKFTKKRTRLLFFYYFFYYLYSWCRILEDATSKILKYKLPQLSNLMLFKRDIT